MLPDCHAYDVTVDAHTARREIIAVVRLLLLLLVWFVGLAPFGWIIDFSTYIGPRWNIV